MSLSSRAKRYRLRLSTIGCLALLISVAGATQGATYTWTGAVSSDFTEAGNWSGGNVANTGTTEASRISVQNGSNAPLLYTATQGTTIYEGDGSGRALFIASGDDGAMSMTGGTFDSRGNSRDGISNGGEGSLTIDGGNYININGGSSTFLVKFGGSGTATLGVHSGSFTVGELRFGDSASSGGTGIVNLDGGTLTANIIRKGPEGTSAVNATFNFNGGALVAGASSTTFLEGLNLANVRDGGAVIDTNGNDITIGQALLHSAISNDAGTDGGLTKTGAGTLTLSGANTYTGVTIISEGTLKMGNDAALGTADGKTIVQSGATLDIAGFKAGLVAESAIGNELIEVSGSGVGGLGALVNTGATQTKAVGSITLLDDTTFGGTGRWDLRYGAFAVGGHTITKVGANTVSIVSATVTNPGDVNVNAGVFRFEGSTNYNAATPVTIAVASGARLDYWGTNITHNPNIVLNGGTVSVNSNSTPSFSGTITLNAGGNIIGVGNEYQSPTLTVTGQITGTGGFTLNGRNTSSSPGTGILILANTTNDYSGTTTISTGTLKLGAAGVIPDGVGKGNVVLNAGTAAAGTFDLNGFSETINGLEGSSDDVLGQVVNNAVGTTSTLTVGNGNATATFAGLLRDNTGTGGVLALTKTGTGTLTLSGANTYTGQTTVNAGVLRITDGAALGDTAGGTTVASGARLELKGSITVTGESLTISGSGGNNRGALQTESGANTWAGNVMLAANETRVGAVGAGNSLTIAGAIGDGDANRTLAIRNDGGTTILSGENTYGGNTDVVIGLLKIDGGDNRLPIGTVLRMGYTEGNDVSTFDLNGWNQQVAGLLARATTTTTIVTNSSATPSILTVNNSGNYTYSGLVTGNLALTKTGSGTLTLSGENTYTGATNVNAGVLRINNASALGGTVAGTTVASGAQLELAGGITVTGETLTISGSGDNIGALQSQSGANTWAGNVILGADATRIGAIGSEDSLTISGNISDGGSGFTLAVRNDAGTTILSGDNNTYGGETHVVVGTLQIGGGNNRLPTGTVLRVGNDFNVTTATFDLNGHNQEVAGLATDGSTMTRTVTNASATPSTLTVNNSGNYSYSGLVTDNLALTKTGTGTLTLSGENTYTGATNVNAGVLRINNASALGGTAAGTTVADGARIELAGGITVSGESLTISGSGGNNRGALQTQTGANTWAGNVTLGANNTRIGAVGAGTSLTVSGAIGDGGNNHALAIYNDGGTTVLSGTNTYSGGTTVSNGILRITKNSALGTGQTTVSVGAQLELSGGITVSDQTIHITGYGASGYGALRSLDGYNVWDGPVYFEGSDSRVGAVNSDSVLEISGEIRDGTSNKVVTVRNNLGKTIFSGENTYTGETRIYNGTLELGAHNSLPVGNPLLLGIGSLDPTFDLKGFNQTIGSLRSEGDGTHTITNTGDSESTLTVTQNSDNVFGGTITNGSNALHLVKAGSSQLTLSGANTYTGLTTVNAGTLLVTGSLANKGSSHVQVASAGTAFGSADPTIVRTVAAGGTFAGLGSQITGSGTSGTQADLMAGGNGSGSSLDVAMAWRQFDSAETAAFPALTNPLSDIVQLTGMGTGETDPFVLQLSYDSSLVQSYHDGMFLAWLSPTDGWTQAVDGNFGSGADAVTGATGSWDSIVDPGDLASYLGSWGVDSTTETVWAVLNHNSQFAVLAVPEPSSLLMAGMGLIGLLLSVRRRR